MFNGHSNNGYSVTSMVIVINGYNGFNVYNNGVVTVTVVVLLLGNGLLTNDS